MGSKKTKVDFILYLLLIFLATNVVLVERCLSRSWNRLFEKSEIEVPESWDVDLAKEVVRTIRREKGVSSATTSQKKGINPLIICPRVRQKVEIDGYLNDPLWSRAGRGENFIVYDSKGKRLATKKTEVFLGYDRQNLYIGFLCRGAPAEHFRASGKRKAQERWGEESFGLLIDNGKEPDSYYRFAVNLDGTVAEAFKEDIGWKGKWSVKTGYRDGCWIGELAIPFRTLGGIKPETGDGWRINFYRRYNIGRRPYLSLWHGSKNKYLDPKGFPLLSFQEEAPRIDIVSLGSSLGENRFKVKIKNLSGRKVKWQFFLRLIPCQGAVSITKEKMEIEQEQAKEIELRYRIKKQGWYSLSYYLQEEEEGKILYASPGYPVKVGPVGEPPLATVSPARTAIVLDGRLEDLAWSEAASLGDFFLADKDQQPARIKTTAYLTFDKENFYLAFQCREPYLAKMKAVNRERDGLVWTDDGVEFFLNPTKNLIAYYHFMLNSLGTQWDEFFLLKEWNASWEAKTSRGEDGWAAEIAIPFSQLGIEEIKEGAAWDINLRRRRYADREELSSWAPTSGSFTDPEKFGTIIFRRGNFPQISIIPDRAPLIGKNSLGLEMENKKDSAQNLTIKIEVYNPQAEMATYLIPVSLSGREKKVIRADYYLGELGTSQLIFSLLDAKKQKTYFRSAAYPLIPGKTDREFR